MSRHSADSPGESPAGGEAELDRRPARALVLGRNHRTEFQAALQTLRANAEVTSAAPGANLASVSTEDTSPPDLIVLLQSFSGEFGSSRIKSVAAQNPLAPIVCVLGSYSEGETRSGRPLPGAHRLFWYEAAAALEAGFDDWRGGRCSWWSWPTTLTGVERTQLAQQQRTQNVSGNVGIFAATRQAAEPLCELLATFGATPIMIESPSQTIPPLVAALWDSAAVSRFCPLPLVEAVALVAPAPVIALVTFPRVQDVQLAKSCGASSVLAKLHTATNLRDHLQWAIRHGAATDIKSQSFVA